ncbi:MAG: hypothetical protein ACQEXX_29650 [Bacillota bacterium]
MGITPTILKVRKKVAFFAQDIPPTDGRKHLKAVGKHYNLELGEVRNEVADFFFEMEKQLRANEDKKAAGRIALFNIFEIDLKRTFGP